MGEVEQNLIRFVLDENY